MSFTGVIGQCHTCGANLTSDHKCPTIYDKPLIRDIVFHITVSMPIDVKANETEIPTQLLVAFRKVINDNIVFRVDRVIRDGEGLIESIAFHLGDK